MIFLPFHRKISIAKPFSVVQHWWWSCAKDSVSCAIIKPLNIQMWPLIRRGFGSQKMWKEQEKYSMICWRMINVLFVLTMTLLRAIANIFNRKNITKSWVCGATSTRQCFLLPASLNCRQALLIDMNTSMNIAALKKYSHATSFWRWDFFAFWQL